MSFIGVKMRCLYQCIYISVYIVSVNFIGILTGMRKSKRTNDTIVEFFAFRFATYFTLGCSWFAILRAFAFDYFLESKD